MKNIFLYPSKVNGAVKVPSSKSHTLRAILFAALAEGKSTIYDPLDSLDTKAMLTAVTSMGAKVLSSHPLTIEGVKGVVRFNSTKIHAENSGIVGRFFTPLAALSMQKMYITGDESLKLRRPVEPLLKALQSKQVKVTYTEKKGHFPFWIEGTFFPDKIEVEGSDSQIVSALLLSASFQKKPLEIFVKNPGETPWIDMTLYWLDKMGVTYEQKNYSYYKVQGKMLSAFTYQTPGDFSSALFMAIAALLAGEVTLKNLNLEDPQGDKIVFSWLKQMGGKIFWEKNRVKVKESCLEGGTFDGSLAIDALPILAVLGCYSKRGIRIENCEMARFKESNRIDAIASQLRKMGGKVETGKDFLHSYPSMLKGAKVYSFKDHRIAMALAIASLKAKGKTEIEDIACVAKTYPHFFHDLKRLLKKPDLK